MYIVVEYMYIEWFAMRFSNLMIRRVTFMFDCFMYFIRFMRFFMFYTFHVLRFFFDVLYVSCIEKSQYMKRIKDVLYVSCIEISHIWRFL